MRTNSKTQHGRSYRHRERAVGNLYANSMHGVSTFESDNDYEDGLTDYSTTNTDAETSAFNTPLFRSPVRQLEAQREKEQEIGHESTDTGRIEQSQGSAAPAGPSGNHATNAGSDSNAYRTSHSTSAMTSVDVSNGGNGDCNDTDDKQSTAATTVTAPSTPPVPRRTRTSSFTFDLTKHHVDTNSTDSRIIVEPHSNLPGNTDDDDTVIDINNKAPTPTTIDPNIDTSFTFDTLYHNQSDHHHHHHQQYTHARVHNTNISSRLMKALMDAMIDIDLNDQTYELHHEIVNILLVLVSTQLYGPLSPAYHNIFLNIIIEGAPANRAAEFIQTLLFNFMGRLSDDSAGSAASSDTTSGPATSVPVRSKSSTRAISDAFTNNNNINFMHKYNSHQQNLNSNVITRWTSHLSSIIRFSLSIYHYFFPPPPVRFYGGSPDVLTVFMYAYSCDIDGWVIDGRRDL